MGISSKALSRIQGLPSVPVTKTVPNFKSASLFGGIIRKKAAAAEVSRPIRKSVGELGRVEKAKDAKGHGSEKRGGSAEQTVDMSRTDGMATYNKLKADGYKTAWSGEGKIHMVKPPGAKANPQEVIAGIPADGFDSQKRWGNSAIRGVGVNSPAMMEARRLAKAKDAKGHGSNKRGEAFDAGHALALHNSGATEAAKDYAGQHGLNVVQNGLTTSFEKKGPMKYYVGHFSKSGGRDEVFQHDSTPTEESHGKQYGAATGPFRTLAGAQYMAQYSQHNNPHLQTVDDAERLAAKYPDRVMHPDAAAKGIRAGFADQIPKSPTDKAGLNAYNAAKMVQEQSHVDFRTAMKSVENHLPELFADHWDKQLAKK